MSKIKGKQLVDIILTPSDTPLNVDSYSVSATGSGKQLINKDYLDDNFRGTASLQQTTDIDNITTNDIEISDLYNGIILMSLNSTRWRVTINTHGQMLTCPIDVDAELFISAYSITDGNQQDAINVFVTDIKGRGNTPNKSNLWTDVFVNGALYPFVGGSSFSHTGNLINPGSYSLTFNGSPTHSSTGVYFNGSSYAQTGITPSIDLTTNDVSLSGYVANNIVESAYIMGYSNVGGTSRLSLTTRRTGDLIYWDCYNTLAGSGRISGTMTDNSGLITSTRTSATYSAVYRNDSSLFDGVTSGGIVPVGEIWIGALNNTVGGGNYMNNEMRLASISLGMNSLQITDWNDAVQRFQYSLGRQV